MPHRPTDDDDDPAASLDATAAAGSIAAADAVQVAKSVAETSQAAQVSARTSADVVAHAKAATAAAVAAAASAAAGLAAETAAALADEAAIRAERAARSAASARDAVAAALPAKVDPADSERAALIASEVAADVVIQASRTRDAAALVAQAVTTAADVASVAASDAAASAEAAADAAAASARTVSELSAESQVAADTAVASTARFADLGLILRAAAAERRTNARGNRVLVEQLQAAVAHSELRLHYQPIYDMQSGAILGLEALLRWQHPTRGLLPPAEFIAVAESHPDLVDPIGDWVLAAAIAQAGAWRSAYGSPSPRIWVNVSCEQLGSRRLCAVIGALLSEAEVPSAALGVEVTERQLIETTSAAATDLAGLRDLGVPLALDDFGTGYASLEYLRRFTFDEIKIDGTFVSGVGQNRTDTAVVSSIIELARSLELTVVAEGVETQAQYDHLVQLGCESCQGYLLHRPADPVTIGELLGADQSVHTGSGAGRR